MNGSTEPPQGVTRAAAIVPMPLTAISSSSIQPTGPTCLNHSTSTRSESRTTIGHRSYSALQRARHQSEFHECESQASRGPMSRGLQLSGGGASRLAIGPRRPAAEWPPTAKLSMRSSSGAAATVPVASRCSSSLLLRPMQSSMDSRRLTAQCAIGWTFWVN